jgi:ABC-type uncharacterized transport system substrate-binding protein
LAASVAWPLAAWAQKAPVVIGFLGSQAAAPPPKDPQTVALNQGFLDYGLIQGRDFIFEQRFTAGDDERFPEFARDLARLNARMILANTPAGVRAAQRLDPPLPVVMIIMNDPVGAGLVASLAHPGNHTTGTANLIGDPGIGDLRDRIAALAQMHRLPLFSTSPLIVEAGGLVSYGASVYKILRRTGYYVKKILDGVDPVDLPIEQPTGLELIINLKTAKMLGIEIPATLLSRADRVIE